MAVPDFQTIMLPLLECLADERERSGRDLTEELGRRFGLTADELADRLPSGQQSVFSNRVAWTNSHLERAGLIENPTRGLGLPSAPCCFLGKGSTRGSNSLPEILGLVFGNDARTRGSVGRGSGDDCLECLEAK